MRNIARLRRSSRTLASQMTRSVCALTHRHMFVGVLILLASLLTGCSPSVSHPASKATPTSTPADQATLYAAFAAGYLIAFRASDGAVRWRIKGYTESPVVADGVLYTASGGDLVALRPQSDGVTEVWRTPLDTTALTSTPVLREGILYVNSSGLTANHAAPNGSVFAVDV